MLRRLSIFLFFALLFISSSGVATENKESQTRSQQPSETEGTGPGASEDKLSITQHTLNYGAKTLNYKATAGYLKLTDDKGKVRANMFFVAYEKEPVEDRQARPIAFIFNGGPGAASVWLHLGAIGPKRVPTKDVNKGAHLPPYHIVENEYTWLDFTDLVFIDPVGTGFSRPAQGVEAKEFFGIKEDIQSVGEFIRLYTTRYDRWLSPKFIVGESYGTFRAVGLTEHLYKNYGMNFNGIVLISLALNFQNFSFELGNDLPYVLFLPTYTASSWYHKKLAPELQKDMRKAVAEAEQWALEEYLPALAKGDSLAKAEREKIAQKLAYYTGISSEFIRNNDLRINRNDYMNELLRAENLTLGLMDSRDTMHGEPGSFLGDPGISGITGPYASGMNQYVREELKFDTDLPYIFLSFETNGQWNWGSAIKGYVNIAADLQEAIRRTKDLRVFVASGYFDLDTPFFGAHYTMSHLSLPADLQSNITSRVYEGGHMLYTEASSLEKLTSDVAAFVRSSIPAR